MCVAHQKLRARLLQVLQRLQAKRASLEKELAKLPGAPSSAKDIFHLCRGFERVFCYTVEVHLSPAVLFCSCMGREHALHELFLWDAVQTTDYAGYIRRAFMADGLMGTVAKLPLERKFKLEHVKEVRGRLCCCMCVCKPYMVPDFA